MKEALVILAVLAPAGAAVAQATCPPPVVQVWQHNQEVPSTGAPFAPNVTVLVSSSPACANGDTYRFREAEVTLLRGRRPVTMTMLVHRPQVDLSDFAPNAQPGDRIHVFVWYKNLYVVAANGALRPYPHPALSEEQQRGMNANLVMDEAKGIWFNWVLQK
jgi:hypothetical protein